MAARGEGGGQENQMSPFEVTKSVISLYVENTKWGAVIRGEERQSEVPGKHRQAVEVVQGVVAHLQCV